MRHPDYDCQHDHADYVVDHRGAYDDPGFLGVHDLQVLYHLGGYPYARGDHGGPQEQSMVHVAVIGQHENEAEYEREYDAQRSDEERCSPNFHQVAYPHLQTYGEQQEYDAHLRQYEEELRVD
ncbi:hypothetical protein SDC9_115761 [bioreactor metagenome]|uniref:Uncharacterized protein n=1 Tax=bioreactor metagenome TaxID=1076179 RepID=A0A645BUE9_9ZZZZ